MSLSLQKDSFLVVPVLFPLIMLFAILLVYTAWYHDDAFITFKTVDNFVHGYGLTWNISERVETYSNPLWMFLVSIPYFFSNEIFYTGLILSITISVITVLIFAFKISKTVLGAILGIGIFIFSKTFIDYSTSGLENPLTHLLLAIFLLVYIKSKNNFNFKILFLLSIITAFGAINRIDTVVFFLPCLVYTFLKLPKIKGLYIIALGLLPAIIWKGLALFYYGFLLPNTAYAKVISTGVSKNLLLERGLTYFANLASWDPITFFFIFAGISIPFFIKDKHLIPVIFGIILYLIFILQMGGDYMSYRFFSAPLFVAVVLLSQYNFTSFRRIPIVALSAIVIVVGILTPYPSLFTDEDYRAEEFFGGYIGDERGRYISGTGLLNYQGGNLEIPPYPWAIWGSEAGKKGDSPILFKSVGMYGYYAGPKIHIVDPYGIIDPLVSKLPLTKNDWWVIGHFYRTTPAGYLESIESGENVIEDKCLAKYYDKLSIITKGDLFDSNRIQEIWNMNTGQYDYLVDAYMY